MAAVMAVRIIPAIEGLSGRPQRVLRPGRGHYMINGPVRCVQMDGAAGAWGHQFSSIIGRPVALMSAAHSDMFMAEPH